MDPEVKIFFSQNLESLADLLMEELCFDLSSEDPMSCQTILVDQKEMKDWLLLYIAKKRGIAMGLQVIEKEALFSQRQSPVERTCSLYSLLKESQHPELLSYLEGKKQRTLSLCFELSSLFKMYELYEPLLDASDSWQMPLFEKSRSLIPNEIKGPLFCFGIDFFPPIYWNELLKASSLSLFLFSPCLEFWQDICTDKERHFLARMHQKKGGSEKVLDEWNRYLDEQPKNLANWGSVGKKTLQKLDALHPIVKENYAPLEAHSLLKKIQHDFLHFQTTERLVKDSSIEVLLTGNSKLNELEACKEKIIQLQIPYHEISVLAPDITPYIPLIEYLFEGEIPYRILKADVSSRSPLRNGLLRIMSLGTGRWESDEVLSLFENPSFYRKQALLEEDLDTIKEWIQKGSIRWGIDPSFQSERLESLFDKKTQPEKGSWSRGFENLMDQWIFFQNEQINLDLFEKMLLLFEDLKNLSLNEEKTLQDWAITIEKALCFLHIDLGNSYDIASEGYLQSLCMEMKKGSFLEKVPLDLILHFLKNPIYSQVHGSSLHAVRFSSMEEGAPFPAKALFLLGMDEGQFPRKESLSSLYLLRGKTLPKTDEDRYLFLKAIFSARESLSISYSHLSEEDAKPVHPSFFISDLLGADFPKRVYSPIPLEEPKPKILFPNFSETTTPDEEFFLSIQDLSSLAKHPWRFFVEKTKNLSLNREIEETFALQRAKISRSFLENTKCSSEPALPKPIQEVLQKEAQDRAEEDRKQLQSWEVEPFLLRFHTSCSKPYKEGNVYSFPPLVLQEGGKVIKIVGEIHNGSTKGVVSFSEDTFSSAFKVWPQALINAVIFDAHQIFFPRSQKIKTLENPKEALFSLIDYYFHSLKAPSPLLPEWADPFLRKGLLSFLKKVKAKPLFEDPSLQWILSRVEMPPFEEMFEMWSPFLLKVFDPLLKLYPTKGGS